MTCEGFRRWLSPYVDEKLAAGECAQLEDHLNGCAGCRAELASLKEMLRFLRSMEPVEEPHLLPGVRQKLAAKPWWRQLVDGFLAPWPQSLPLHSLALATTAVLVVVVVALPRFLGHSPIQSTEFQKIATGQTGNFVSRQEGPAAAVEQEARDNSRDERAQSVGGAIARGQLEMDEKTTRAKPFEMPSDAELADSPASGVSGEDSVKTPSLQNEASVAEKKVSASGERTSLSEPVPPLAGTPIGFALAEPYLVRWHVRDLKEATAPLSAWVHERGGTIAMNEATFIAITLPIDAFPDFLQEFSSEPPKGVLSESPPGFVPFLLELVVEDASKGLVIHNSNLAAAQSERLDENSKLYEMLSGEFSALSERFGHYSGPLLVQTIRHDNGGSTLLVYKDAAGPRPVLFGISQEGTISWRNYEALEDLPRYGGYVYAPRLAGGDEHQALLLWYGTDPWGVHARLFDGTGKIVWTQEVFKDDGEGHLNLLFWPAHGWLVTYSTFDGVVIQLVGTNGEKHWGAEGFTLSAKKSGYNPVSVIQDTPTSAFILWYDYEHFEEPRRSTTFTAQRIGPDGKRLWAAPVLVGEAPSFALVRPREIELTLLNDSAIQADLYKGIAGDAVWRVIEYTAIISSDGRVKIIDDD
ncbi:MAG: zf-HC2 domain-containing protein [Candidatus Omnitrophica bacterium]|nr:zf-HC2 domain-containing protein [Candidatus Omnitrophota bacterium]MBI3010652.1 zf-HC2 domain-containing protein [Candidatus Omnitrophota bacterium]